MSMFGFDNAVPPELFPLLHSRATDPVNEELRHFTLELFQQLLSKDVFDANVLGSPHLGSFELVRREINRDGLVLLQGDREETAVRYLYRAWIAGSCQGRGLHFLRTYLQLLFPQACEITQVVGDVSDSYPPAGVNERWWIPRLGDSDLKLNGSWKLGMPVAGRTESSMDNRDGNYLTSRVRIALDFETVDAESLVRLKEIFRVIVPARIVPEVSMWIRGVTSIWGNG